MGNSVRIRYMILILVFPVLFHVFLSACRLDRSHPSNSTAGDCVEYDRRNSTRPDTCSRDNENMHCCFINMPEHISSSMTIVPAGEPGTPIRISGRILNADSKEPYRCVILYAYHTDSAGIYSKNGNEQGIQKWHGRLHGWCRTDSLGNYEIRTIRPAQYPEGETPAHIHPVIRLNNGSVFYLNEFVFRDDPLVGSHYQKSFQNPHNPPSLDPGIVALHLQGGVYVGYRDLLIRE